MTKSSSACLKTHRRTCHPGKTTFLAFMLAQLIMAEQVVLIVSPPQLFLFYQGEVYRNDGLNFMDIPECGPEKRIWALIDPCGQVVLNLRFKIWPLWASSPCPDRWRPWIGRFCGLRLGMQLWTLEELNKWYVVHFFCTTIHVICRESSRIFTDSSPQFAPPVVFQRLL